MLDAVPVASLPIERFSEVLDEGGYEDLQALAGRARTLLDGRVVWCVNSTAQGGGVAEMLRALLAYTRGAGVDTRWVVMQGRTDFFAITKRLHNRLHGSTGDGGPLGDAERAEYEEVCRAGADALLELADRDDVVILHDPQTAGIAPHLRAAGRDAVVWRCHVGVDHADDVTRSAWDFLRPYVDAAPALVFSREAFTWEGIDPARVTIIPPSIDVFSAKNQELSEVATHAILGAAGLVSDGPRRDALFVREDGSPGRVDRRAEIVEDEPLTSSTRMVVQVSRWDRLKDPVGVLRGFADHVADHVDAHLVLAGPASERVSDDPEGALVLDEVVAARTALPDAVRARVHLVSLPMDDAEENAAMVNALQRRADVVVQKSLAEGFGLTASEAMWKARPLVASAVGGLQDQVVDGTSGLLVDPSDLGAFGDAVRRLLDDADLAARMGDAARERVREEFLEPRHLAQWVDVLSRLR